MTQMQTRDHDWIMGESKRIQALGETAPRLARDPVSQPIINAWLDAIDETDARFTEGVAPPAMAQVWTMPGLRGTRGADDPLSQAMEVLDAAGFTSVLGTNCNQTYERYLEVGEHVSVTTQLEDIAGPKRTGVGEGYFVTTRNVWRVGDEVVATMQFRVLKFKPRPPSSGPDRSQIIRPVRNQDTDFFWEGTQQGELRIQKCNACGATRFPPGPACQSCEAYDRGYDVSAGTGTVFSYVVHRHPPVPGHGLPIVLALVDLEEGVRMVATIEGAEGAEGIEPDAIEIGMPVTVGFRRIDDDLALPVFRPVQRGGAA